MSRKAGYFDLKAPIHSYADNLYLIELTPPLAGFSRFIGAWAYKGPSTVLVDVGPAATVPLLRQALQKIGITHLDYILLTHIHLDHAGGVGALSLHFPDTPIVVHANGLAHLMAPERLWAGSLTTLGETAKAYGPLTAVPAPLLMAADRFKSPAITPLETLGHSPHHVSYLTPDYLFAGEAGGVCIQLPDGRSWMRPATPATFFLDKALSSLNALIALNPDTICYGHFGLQPDAAQYLVRHRAQLLFWERVIELEAKCGPTENLVTRCLDRLLSEDPELVGYDQLPEAEREREVFFLTNSIKGFLSWCLKDSDPLR